MKTSIYSVASKHHQFMREKDEIYSLVQFRVGIVSAMDKEKWHVWCRS